MDTHDFDRLRAYYRRLADEELARQHSLGAAGFASETIWRIVDDEFRAREPQASDLAPELVEAAQAQRGERPAQARPPGLLVAAVLLWVWAVVLAVNGIQLLFYNAVLPTLAGMSISTRPTIFGMAFVLPGLAHGLAGYLVWQRQLLGGQVGLIATSAAAGLQWFTESGVSVGVIVDLAIAFLLVLNWRELRGGA